MTRYLTTDELIYIHEQLPAREPIHRILQGRQKVRDIDLLESAVGRPRQTVFGADAYPTLQAKAAALLHSIARNHPFADGNKRTATIATIWMLQVNGLRVTWQPDEALQHILDIAEGRSTVADFAAWLPSVPGTPALDEDAEADMAAIHQIMADHHWLLSELEKQ